MASYSHWQQVMVVLMTAIVVVMACTDGVHGRNHPQPGGRKETLAATQVITPRRLMNPQDAILYTQAS
jgi:hypothetical protein